MTGYAQAAAGTPRGTLSLELRSVNARFLDLAFRIADELRALEPVLRERLSARLARGKVDCRLALTEDASAGAGRLNQQALGKLKDLAAAAQKAFPEAAPMRVADVRRGPGVIAEEIDDAGLRAIVDELARRALDDFVAARSREGAKLAAGIVERVKKMRARVDAVVPLIPEAVSAYQKKIT